MNLLPASTSLPGLRSGWYLRAAKHKGRGQIEHAASGQVRRSGERTKFSILLLDSLCVD